MGNYQHKHNNIYCLCGCGERLGKQQQKYKSLECNRRQINKLALRKRAKNKADRIRQREKTLLTTDQRSAIAKLSQAKRWEGKVKKTYIPKPKKFIDWNRGTAAGWMAYMLAIPGYAEGVIGGKTLAEVSKSIFRS
jgi:hypothetical protein